MRGGKNNSAPSSAGIHSPMNWPNTWLKGKRVQESERMEDAFVLQVLLHLRLNGPQAGQDVVMSVDDALRLAGGAGSEDDLKSVAAR